MSIVFYYAPMSSAARVHWALEELGVGYEKVKIDLRAGDQKKPEFLKINPNGKVPALTDDGHPLFESAAILIHLGEKYGVAKKLWPAAGTREHGEALSWVVWSSATLNPPATRYMYNSSDRFPKEQQDAKTAAAAKTEIEGLLKLLDGQLQGREYLVGNAFSLADLATAAMVGFLGMLGIDLSAHQNVAAWAARCQQRPAMGRAMQG